MLVTKTSFQNLSSFWPFNILSYSVPCLFLLHELFLDHELFLGAFLHFEVLDINRRRRWIMQNQQHYYC